MATLTVQKTVLAGFNPTFGSAAGGGDEFINTGKQYLQYKNTGGSPLTVTIVNQTPCNYGGGTSVHNVAVVIPATTGDIRIGPLDPLRFNDVNGKVQITYSGVTGLTVAVVELPVK
jgi:hypothetical protein